MWFDLVWKDNKRHWSRQMDWDAEKGAILRGDLMMENTDSERKKIMSEIKANHL